MGKAKNPPPCSVPDCDRPAKTRGMCGMHTERVRKYGTPDLPPREKLHCKVTGCERKHNAHGLCTMHQQRINAGIPLDAPLYWHPPTFDDYYRIAGSGCHEWAGARNNQGYGTYRGGYAHRFAYERSHGPIPKGIQVDHLCRNRVCVNPDHLEAVTQRVNVLRGISPGAIAVRTNRCKRGHEFTPENTYYRPDTGGRQCRDCIRLRERRKQQRRVEVAA